MSNTINNAGNNSQFPDLAISGASAAAGQSASSDQSKSWFEAMAKAWGNALDQQASKVTALSDQVSDGTSGANGQASSGSDNPSVLTQLTAESLKMQFLSTSASTSDNAVGQALDSLGRKQ
jgi:tRNA A37 threonylcarbamoyltransferase TsaD